MTLLKISESLIVSVLFFGYLIFIGTTLKLTLNLTSVSFIFVAVISLLPFLLLMLKVSSARFQYSDSYVILAATSFIVTCLVNLLMQGVSYTGIVQTTAFLLPWLVLLSSVFSKDCITLNHSKYWDWFNNFIVILMFLGLLEYLACFYFGVVPPFQKTANGDFLVGYFTIFHALEPGLAHFRFYGPFAEPGEVAMWGSLLFLYNLFRKQYLHLTILSIGILLSASPSFLISFLVAFGIFISRRRTIGALLALIFVASFTLYFYITIEEFINEVLFEKRFSLEDRIGATIGFFKAFDHLVINYPLGIPFFESSAEAAASNISFPANFTPITAFERGGIIAFSIYVLLALYGSFLSVGKIFASRSKLVNVEIYIYYLMLVPFMVQRAAFFEFGLFAILFSAIFLRHNKRNNLQMQSQS